VTAHNGCKLKDSSQHFGDRFDEYRDRGGGHEAAADTNENL